MGKAEVEAFLNHLAVCRSVVAATQIRPWRLCCFVQYKEVLKIDLPRPDGVVWAKKPARLPMALARDEVTRVVAEILGIQGLVANLLYGAGLRLMESLRLRVKDVDFARSEILVR